MITTNKPHEIPVKAFRVLYQKMFLLFPSLLYKFVLQNKKYDVEIAAIHGMYRELLSSPQKDSKKIIWIQNDIFNLKEYTPDVIRQLFKFDRILVISNKLKEEMQKVARNDKERKRLLKSLTPLTKQIH